ncbi:MAG TPA: phosphoribosyl-AMP cyclohydrolase [Armatimonadota bacterium]
MPYESLMQELAFDANGLVAFLVQDANTKELLTLAYMNREALEKTLETGFIHVFRRSQNRLMMKGEQSGMTQKVVEARLDCASKCLVFLVEPKGPACHTGFTSCYYRRVDLATGELTNIGEPEFDPKEVYGRK